MIYPGNYQPTLQEIMNWAELRIEWHDKSIRYLHFYRPIKGL